MTTMLTTFLLALAIALLQPETPPTGGECIALPQPITSADELLDRIEQETADLGTLTARIRYENEKALIGDTQVRKGTLHSRLDPETGRRQFAVHFDEKQIGVTVESIDVDYIFDGRYLVERLNDERQFNKREIACPDDPEYDPLSIDGPFPLPIGQSRADIVRRFHVEQIENTETGRLAGHYHLRLTPRSSGEDEELEQVDLWYDPETWMPSRVVVLERSGDLNTADVVNYDPQATVEPEVFSTATPAGDWRVDITTLECP